MVWEAKDGYTSTSNSVAKLIDAARDPGVPADSWWEKINNSDWWQVIVVIATVVVIIAAIAAFVVTGPIAIIAAVTAAVLGAVLLADDVMAFAAGEMSGAEFAVMIGLSAIPGGRAARAGAKAGTAAIDAGIAASKAGSSTVRVTTRNGESIVRSRNPDWLNKLLDRTDIEPWRRVRAEWQEFNYQNHHRYPQNEVALRNGKFLDSYVPDVAIVSRKNTQLWDVTPKTARLYIDEMLAKYAPNTPIASGGKLDGRLVLEVPVQRGEIPQAILDHARNLDPQVLIRDVLGHIYN
ncbi:hypothetical protein [Leucobacter komagatae]|uniref:hypothetical protein n=1 Tax=Leucobacter komagatae TaxID=55969 RepID=UPI0012EEDB5D|nr:hypothetical protein [Leucobacter komagatae]